MSEPLETDALAAHDVAAVARATERLRVARAELAHAVVGQESVVEQVLIAVLTRGHALLEGAPGLAKTLLVSSLARATHLTFKRIQFTPDLMPSDVTGADVIQEDPRTRERDYKFLPGPLFANLVLADEINRTPPKTQAAMLEAMQERQISAGGRTHALPNPFFVLATQNPLEQEGTYPLPEAQLDRFLLYIKVDYPSAAEEWDIVRQVTSGRKPAVNPIMSAEELLALQALTERIPVSDQVLGYACALARRSRPTDPQAPDFVKRWVQWGAGPRGVVALVSAAKARALLHGRHHASAADIQALAKPALRHRIAGNYAAHAENIDSDVLIDRLLQASPADQPYPKPAA